MVGINKKINIKRIFISILCFASFIAIFSFLSNIEKSIKEQVVKLIGKTTSANNESLDGSIQDMFKVLNTIAYNISSHDLSDPQKVINSFDSVVKEIDFNRIAFVNSDGIAYFNDDLSLDLSDVDYFKEAFKGDMYVSSMVHSKVDGKKINMLSVPIYKNKEIVAVLGASILTNKLYSKFNVGNIRDLGDTFIVDADGNIIVTHDSSVFNSENINIFDDLKSNGVKVITKEHNYNSSGYSEVEFSNGKNYILYYEKLSYRDWWGISIIAGNKVKGYYEEVLQHIMLVIIIITLFISLVLYNKYNKNKDKIENIKSLAYKDTITGGNNDKYLKDNIFNMINEKGKFAFVSLEIINIRGLITIVGHNNVKSILKEIYEYLSSILNEDETVIHSYLGEYKLLIKYDNVEDLTKRLETINFYNINENIKFIMGVYLIDNLKTSFEDMYSYVGIAKEFVGNNSNSNYIIYNKEIHKSEAYKLKLEEDIKNGIKNKEFKAWFQPKYSKDDNSIIGAEALVRWHKYGSIVSPYVFVPLCEANGLIKEIDELVFEDVCKNISEWTKNNKNVVPISVNLSRRYLDKENFLDNLEKYIDKYNVSKELINFEITESSLIGNEDKLKDIVSLLHERGFKVLLDDFGVGYSSVKSISEVDFDVLKIDKSFVDGIGEEKWKLIIKYTINLAKQLGMDVVVEGIETEEQYKFLLKCDCDMFQGYYFSKPMSPNDFSNII